VPDFVYNKNFFSSNSAASFPEVKDTFSYQVFFIAADLPTTLGSLGGRSVHPYNSYPLLLILEGK